MKPYPSFVMQKQLLLIVAVGLFADYFLLSVVIPILPDVFGSEGYKETDIGYVFSAKPAVQIVSNIFMGPVVNRAGANVVLTFTTFILALSTGLFVYGLQQASNPDVNIVSSHEDSVAYGYKICIVARGIQGMASSGIMAGGMALIAESHDESIHGKAMSMAVSGIAAGVVLGPPLGGVISYAVDVYTPFYIVMGIVVIDLIGQLWYLRRSQKTKVGDFGWPAERYERLSGKRRLSMNNSEGGTAPNPIFSSHDLMAHDENNVIDFQSNIRRNTMDSVDSDDEAPKLCDLTAVLSLLGNPRICIVALGNLLGNFCVGMMEVLLPLFLIKQFKYNKLHQGLTFAAMSLSYLLATPLSGALSDKVKKWKIFGVGPLIAGIGLVLFYWSESLAVTIVGLIVTGVGVAFIDTPSIALLGAIAAEHRIPNGSIFALQDMCVCLGFMLGPLLATQLQKHLNFNMTCVIAGCILLLYTPCTCFLSSIKGDDREGSSNRNTKDGATENYALQEDDTDGDFL
jgi:MFS family permease